MEPVAAAYQPPAGLSLPFPAFAEGDPIGVEAAGGAWAPFALAATGVAPLVLAAGPLRLADGEPLTLAWTAPSAGVASKMSVKLDISHHGGTRGHVACEAADTGSLEIDRSLITRLLALGVAGYPTVVATRSTTGSTTIAPGRVDLVVMSEVETPVEIPGLTSCTAEADCPAGQTCQTDLSCR
jgi:hypothetical protein